MVEVKTHTFNSHKYKIFLIPEGVDGICDQPAEYDTLVIATELNARKGLISAIHEAMHACSYDKTEKTVDRCSKDIGKFLWRLGFRVKK